MSIKYPKDIDELTEQNKRMVKTIIKKNRRLSQQAREIEEKQQEIESMHSGMDRMEERIHELEEDNSLCYGTNEYLTEENIRLQKENEELVSECNQLKEENRKLYNCCDDCRLVEENVKLRAEIKSQKEELERVKNGKLFVLHEVNQKNKKLQEKIEELERENTFRKWYSDVFERAGKITTEENLKLKDKITVLTEENVRVHKENYELRRMLEEAKDVTLDNMKKELFEDVENADAKAIKECVIGILHRALFGDDCHGDSDGDDISVKSVCEPCRRQYKAYRDGERS